MIGNCSVLCEVLHLLKKSNVMKNCFIVEFNSSHCIKLHVQWMKLDLTPGWDQDLKHSVASCDFLNTKCVYTKKRKSNWFLVRYYWEEALRKRNKEALSVSCEMLKIRGNCCQLNSTALKVDEAKNTKKKTEASLTYATENLHMELSQGLWVKPEPGLV